ncbi:MAG: hypothetical protein ACOYIE_06660 [Agathobaculum sp.]|uniref:hypothetical protein n=1 Tax=Agathobaculum sp. TaxID=2048138 RepID=UPI003D945D64
MTTPYDETLRICSEQIARQNKLRAMQQRLYDQLRELESREQELAAIRAKEQRDVDRLEGHSLAALFYGITGKKEERLSTEQQQAYAAALRHEGVLREIKTVRQELLRCDAELTALHGCGTRYAEALAAKADLLKQRGAAQAADIIQLEQRAAAQKQLMKELNEAIDAGQAAGSAANALGGSLSSAEGWGTFDLFGGGLLTTMAKHSQLDEAQEHAAVLQERLRRFQAELSDITIRADIQVRVDGFLRFADYFFDGLLADWAVLDHIQGAQAQLEQTQEQIQTVLEQLYAMQEQCAQQQRIIQDKLDELVRSV